MGKMMLIRSMLCLICAIVMGAATSTWADASVQTDKEAEWHFEKANELLKRTDYDDAIAEYQKVVNLSSGSKIAQDAQYWIGQSQFRAGRFDAAQATFARLIEQYPTSAIVPVAKLMVERVQEAKKTEATKSAMSDTAGATTKFEAGLTSRRVPGGEAYSFTSLSPDGRYLCGADMRTGDLAVYELATGKQRRLTNKGSWKESFDMAQWSAISPDSKRVAYQWFNTKDVPNDLRSYDLRIIGLDGSGDHVLRRGDYLIPRDWSRDNKQILGMLCGKDKETEIKQLVWVSADDGSMRVVKTLGKPLFAYRETFVNISPDGRYIAYDMPQEEGSSKRDIFLCPIDGTDETPLVQHPANDKLLGWTPDGTSVLFTSDRSETWDAWLQQVENGKPKALPELAKPNVGDIVPIGFTPRGSYYYETHFGEHEVLVAELDLQAGKVLVPPKPIHTGSTNAVRPDWSPDGQYLAYYTRRKEDRSPTIHIRDLKTGEDRTVSVKLPGFNWLRWCPDGRSLLVPLGGDICRIDVKTGECTTLLQTKEKTIQAELSPDGETLFLVCGMGGEVRRVLIRDLKDSQERQLFEIPVSYGLERWALSPDGRCLAVSFQDLTSFVLKTIPAEGGTPKELLRIQKTETEGYRIGSIAWTPDSQQVIFARENELWRISAEGGKPQKLWESPNGFLDVRIHPDGQHVAFAIDRSTHELWVMENFLPTR